MDNDDSGEITIPGGTITIDDLEDTIMVDTATINMASAMINQACPTYTTAGALGSSYTYSTGASGSFYTSPGANGSSWANVTISQSNPNLSVTGDANFDGDITVKGRSLTKLLEKVEDRLAILNDPDPKKLEKYAALKKAYDNYKLLEKLIGEDDEDANK